MKNKIVGVVSQVTSEGDLVTDIQASQLSSVPTGEGTHIVVDDEHETFGIFPPDHQQPPMTLIAIAAPEEPLRLHLVGDSATMMLGVRPGAKIQIKWSQ